MEVNQDKAKAAQDCLEFNPMINTVYVTVDLSCFANRNAAINHARGFDNKEIDVFIRTDNAAVIDIDQTDDVTNESLTVPDPRLAVVKAAGDGKDKVFSKIPAAEIPIEPVVDTPVIGAVDGAATDKTGIIDKLNEIVNETEHLLGLDQQKAV